MACAGIIKAATTIGTNISTGGTLDVTGASTLTGNTNIAGSLTSSGANTFYGATSIGGALTATSTLDVTGLATFSSNVGIGTTSPYAKLSVVGEVVGSYFTATSTTATSTFANGIYITSGCFRGADGSCISSGGGGSGTVNTGSAGYLSYYPSGGTTVDDASNLYWDNTNSRLGIGTSSPYAKLSVVGEAVASYFTATSTTATSTFSGNLVVSGEISIGGVLPATLGTSAFSINTSEVSPIQIYSNNLMINRFVSDGGISGMSMFGYTNTSTNGGVFLGASSRGSLSSPSPALSGDWLFRLQAAGGNGVATFDNGWLDTSNIIFIATQNFAPNGAGIGDDAAGSKISFRTHGNSTGSANPTERLVINQNGYLGINVATPTSAMLEIIPSAVGTHGLKITGATSQAGSLQEWLPGATPGTHTPSASTGNIIFVDPTATQLGIAGNFFPTLYLEGYGNNGTPQVIGRLAAGTRGSATATTIDKTLLYLGGQGRKVSGWTSDANFAIVGNAAENFTDTAHGTYIGFQTTQKGTATLTNKFTIQDDFAVTVISTTTEPSGCNATTANGSIAYNGTANKMCFCENSQWKSIGATGLDACGTW